MGSSGKKSSAQARKSNAEKQARWRRVHPDKYQSFLVAKKLQARINKGLRKSGGWIVFELVNDDGEIMGLTIRHHLRPVPERGRLSDFLPHSPLNYQLAKALRDARLFQLRAWRGRA